MIALKMNMIFVTYIFFFNTIMLMLAYWKDNYLYTFDTFGSKLIFITFCTIDLVFLGYE